MFKIQKNESRWTTKSETSLFSINLSSATLPESPLAKKQLLGLLTKKQSNPITMDKTNEIAQAGILTAINCVIDGR